MTRDLSTPEVESVPAQDAVLNTKEASAYVGLAESTLQKTRHRSGVATDVPHIPFTKVAGRITYLKSDLDHWLSNFKIKGRTTHQRRYP